MFIVYLIGATVTLLVSMIMLHHPAIRGGMLKSSLYERQGKIDGYIYSLAVMVIGLCISLWPVAFVALIGYLFYKLVSLFIPYSWKQHNKGS